MTHRLNLKFFKEMELTPDDLLFPVPKYVTWDRQEELKERLDKMTEIIRRLPPKPEADVNHMSMSEAWFLKM